MGIEDEPDQAGVMPKPAAKTASTKPTAKDNRDVGAALRSVYQKTVEEQVPDEFLDLLGRLG